jgi:hypothetical protein
MTWGQMVLVIAGSVAVTVSVTILYIRFSECRRALRAVLAGIGQPWGYWAHLYQCSSCGRVSKFADIAGTLTQICDLCGERQSIWPSLGCVFCGAEGMVHRPGCAWVDACKWAGRDKGFIKIQAGTVDDSHWYWSLNRDEGGVLRSAR